MTIRECDGTDDGLIMYIDLYGDPVDDPQFGVVTILCDCGSRFDDTKHELTWPHSLLNPSPTGAPMTDLPDIAGFL